ncbi:glycoside hydrolase family 38 C-terminal domain-containing protein [Enterobacter sp.]|uniref:glycoside hydrolase family 38 N-terminal domain-containing protein n=1 Tax=Enterobacter sp. TaxID=42895 RepID=UPI00296E8411|nr:glycoside hydrolase family 38 C-terminal domain-containing protein [Enterobacter sp.]
MKKKQIYVVAHCHWDAEWYFTCEDSHILLVENLDYLLDLLETDASFTSYTFDGLAIVLDDYLQVRPENEARLKALISARRLFVGPWYTQCDSLLIRTESLIRNLQYGIATAERFGHSMNVGYLPDIFGQHAYLPALFRDLGIDYCVLQRGIYTDQIQGDLNLNWRAPNQQTIATNYLYYGYGPGKFLSTDKAYLEGRLLPILEQLAAMNTRTDKILLPCGGDQVLPNASFPATVRALNAQDLPWHFQMADYESYMRDAWSESEFSHTLDGELFACQKSRIHRTCHSTRYDLKRQTWRTEQLLLDKLEPLTVIAQQLNVSWPAPLMDEMWKKVFSAQAHNGIEASNADAVNQNNMVRLVSVERSALSLINLLKKKISHQIACQLEQNNILTIFNGDISPLDGLVSAVIFTRHKEFALTQNGEAVALTVVEQTPLDGGQIVIVTAGGEKLQPVEGYWRSEVLLRVPPMRGLGYQTLLVEEGGAANVLSQAPVTAIENVHYALRFVDGGLTLENRLTGQSVTDFLRFVDCGDDGDEFDFAPLEDETPIDAGAFRLIACETGDLLSRMTLESTLLLPADMNARKARAGLTPMTITTTLGLRAREPLLRITHALVNAAQDHRLRVQIKTPVVNPAESWADQGFSLIRRDTRSRYLDGWREQGFVEKPVPIYTMENLVCLRDGKNVMAAITQGIKEYEVLPDEDTLALTLYRSVGLLGKDDTPWRPGRASGINNKVVETPDAQLLQPMTFHYALLLDAAKTDAALLTQANRYRERYLSYQLQTLNTFEERLERFSLPLVNEGIASYARWLTLDNPNLLMSVCKPGAAPDEIILRVFNPGEQAEKLVLKSTRKMELFRLSLREERVAPLAGDVMVAARDYLTLAVVLGPPSP